MNTITRAASIQIDDGVLTVSGVLDFDSVLELQAPGAQWIRDVAPAQFVLDLDGVKYSSSAGLALLLDWLRAAASVGKQGRLARMPGDMQALVQVSSLENLLPMA